MDNPTPYRSLPKPLEGKKPGKILNSAVFNLGERGFFSNAKQPDFVLALDNYSEPTRRGAEYTSLQYIPFLREDNNLLRKLYGIVHTSPTTRAILKNKTTLSLGSGFFATQGRMSAISNIEKPESATPDRLVKLSNYIDNIGGNGASLSDVLERVLMDYWAYGNAFVELRRAKISGKNYLTVHHIPVAYARPKKVSATNQSVEFIGISNQFEETISQPLDVIDLPLYPVFSQEEDGIQHSIIHLKEYSPQFFYWGVPDWIASIIWAENEYRTVKFNQSKFKNSYIPSCILTIKAEITKEEAEEKIKQIREKFTDTGNNSKMYVEIVSDLEYASKLQILETKNEGEFLKLEEVTTNKIITAHRWTPSLAGIKTPGQLGSNQQIKNEYEIIGNTVIKPVQKMVENKIIKAILKESSEYNEGADWQNIALYFKELNIVSFASQLAPTEVMETNEQREALGLPPIDDPIDPLTAQTESL